MLSQLLQVPPACFHFLNGSPVAITLVSSGIGRISHFYTTKYRCQGRSIEHKSMDPPDPPATLDPPDAPATPITLSLNQWADSYPMGIRRYRPTHTLRASVDVGSSMHQGTVLISAMSAGPCLMVHCHRLAVHESRASLRARVR